MVSKFLVRKIAAAIASERYEWRKHALKRMLKREIRSVEVIQALISGEIIEEYLDDQPFPSALFLGELEEDIPLHVVVSYDEENDWAYIVTVYWPDPDHFDPSGRERRKKVDE